MSTADDTSVENGLPPTVCETADMLTAALTLVERFGWEIFPANLEDGEKKSYKSAAYSGGAKWGKTRDPDEIRRDFRQRPLAGIGVPTGVDNGVFVVETDTKEGHDVDGATSLRALEDEYGALPDTLMAVSPSGSLHRYYNHPRSGLKVKNSTSEIGSGIDVRGDGGMVIAPPSVRPGKGAYRWINWGTPIADPPPWIVGLVTAEHRERTRTNTTAANGPLPEHLRDYVSTGAGTHGIVEEMIRDAGLALRATPNPDVGWEKWNNTMMATWASTLGRSEGLVEFTKWSRKSKKHDDAETAARWAHLFASPPTEIGFGTLAYLAEQANPGWRYPALEVLDPMEASPDIPQSDDAAVELHARLEEPKVEASKAEASKAEETPPRPERPPHYDLSFYGGICRRIWGEPTSRTNEVCRFREDSSVIVNTTTWEWFDYATGETGDRHALRRKAGSVERPRAIQVVDISTWDDVPVPEQHWAVKDRIPTRCTTIFSGEGAAGKSLIQLALSVACVLGKSWLGTTPEQGPAIFIDAEDEVSVIHKRLADILRYYDARFADVRRDLHVISLAGEDAVLATLGRGNRIEPTALYRRLLEMVGDIRPRMMGIASSADVFAGSEIDRSQVQQFVALLTKLAMTSDGAVVLISHPSVAGISTGTGLSGSTQWHNSVRARFYLESVKSDGEQTDSKLRRITFKKSNYGPDADNITVRYENGLFVPIEGQAFDAAARLALAKNIFVDLLRRFTRENRRVSANPGPGYAPSQFALEQEARAANLGKEVLANAMRALLQEGTIIQEPYGRTGHQHYQLVIQTGEEAM